MKGPSKRTWQEYHSSYGGHVVRFHENGRNPLRLGEVPSSLGKVFAIRFSRYISALWQEVLTDEYAKGYHQMANQIICRCIPVPDRPGFCYLELQLDPGVAADEMFLAAEEAQREAKAKAAAE